MQLTRKQLSRIRLITDNIERHYGSGARVHPAQSFRLLPLDRKGKGAVMLCSNNIDNMKWFETCYRCTITIGPRGGIERYEGTMMPKLLLPVMPLDCNYENPFKK